MREVFEGTVKQERWYNKTYNVVVDKNDKTHLWNVDAMFANRVGKKVQIIFEDEDIPWCKNVSE